MEPNIKPATGTNSNDSSVSSLVSSFGLIDVTTTSGPINGLPNEMIKHIVAQLKQKPVKSYYNYKYYYDVRLLVQLRLVCTRWRAIVEDFCLQIKSLCVNSEYELDFYSFTPLIVNSIRSAHFFSVMPKLFPNIVQLDIGCLPNIEDTEMANVVLNISQLSSLKQLDLEGLENFLPFISQILSQLEHILVSTSDNYILTEEEFLQFVGSLGRDCVRVFLTEGVALNYHKLCQWHSLKPHFFANVTHFEFVIEMTAVYDDYQQIVHFLSVHAPSLKLLNFFAQNEILLTVTLLADLRNLTNLSELELWNILMDLPELEEASEQNRLPRLSSVSICSLNYVNLNLVWSGDRFMRILSSIFPNLVDLELQFYMETQSQISPEEFEQYLDRFPNLRKHSIHFIYL